jgi:hypothetical protein
MGPVTHRPRRPALFGPAALATFEAPSGSGDPARRLEAAHATARALVTGLRAGDGGPDGDGRLVRLADEHGLEALAELWSECAPDSLPGALWRLYVLRAWVRADPEGVARLYDAGQHRAPVLAAVAGVADPPGPREVEALADAVLSGLVRGDLGVALERAAAFCRIVAAGRVIVADEADDDAGFSGARLLRTGEQLHASARAARTGHLD